MVFSSKQMQFGEQRGMKIRNGILFVIYFVVTALVGPACDAKPLEESAVLANTMAPKVTPGVEFKVLQSASDQRVYFVFGGKRHYVPSAATLEAMGLVKQVTSVPDVEINRIPLAAPLPQLTSKVIQRSSGEVYIFENGKRRHVPDPETLRSLHIDTKQIQGVSNSVADAFPLGAPLVSMAHK